MDILDDMSKLSAKVFSKIHYSFKMTYYTVSLSHVLSNNSKLFIIACN